jgi:hypothetical protein
MDRAAFPSLECPDAKHREHRDLEDQISDVCDLRNISNDPEYRRNYQNADMRG